MNESNRMFMIIWPYAMLTAGLFIALIANYRIRKRSKQIIEDMDGQKRFMSSLLRKKENDRTEEIISSAKENARLQSNLREIKQGLDKTLECAKRDGEQIAHLRAALVRIHPYARLVVNDPRKMEAWLERLMKPKPKKRKTTAQL